MANELVQGNEAIARGALAAGLRFFAGYPITPASEIMHYLADKKISFIQPEDEIASINLCLGASLVGKKSMTATSGPGFSLMQESIGFGHMARIPMVIVNSQRVGPSTGMPTLPSQGDILQSFYGSHGDFFPIVFYPNSVKECFSCAIHAFNASEESRTPVILLSDALLSHLYETVDLNEEIEVKGRKKELLKGKKHFTGLLSRGNIPSTNDSKYYNEWFMEYKTEIDRVAKDYEFYEYLDNKNSETLIVSYGFTSRIIQPLKEEYSFFRPIRMFPILRAQIEKISKRYKKVIVIEMNNGQYASELKKILGKRVYSIGIMGGRINLREIKEKLEHLNE